MCKIIANEISIKELKKVFEKLREEGLKNKKLKDKYYVKPKKDWTDIPPSC